VRNTNAEDAPKGARRFYSVAEVARMFGMSSMTLYREIADERFPAIRIRTRLFVPARALDEMAEAAMATRSEVSAADWVVRPNQSPTMPTAPDLGGVETGGLAPGGAA
jgi:excisionase family DNA binding protein